MIRVLFVCLGNICRSPTAEGVFTTLVQRAGLGDAIAIDSAGTGAWHVGKAPDQRAQDAARARGIDLSVQRARQLQKSDFIEFDYLLAMDESNLTELLQRAPAPCPSAIALFLDYAPGTGYREVPDPYYGDGDGFETVLDLVTEASVGLLKQLRERHKLP